MTFRGTSTSCCAWRMSGGSSTIRRRPSTSSVSFGSAARLVCAGRARSSARPCGSDDVCASGRASAPRRRRCARTRRRAAPSPRVDPCAAGTPRPCPAPPAPECRAERHAPRRDDEAGRESLHVPFPGAGQRLVEVVDIEHEVTFGGGEDAEVEQVRVAARLDAEPGRRRGGEVVRPSPPPHRGGR